MSFAKRLSVPIGIAAIVALIVGFGPSLLASARPTPPSISAEQLLTNVARSQVEGLSGVVEWRSELGLPALPSGQGAHDYGVAPRDLLTGTHTMQVAVAGPKKQRIALLGELAQYTFVHNRRDVWAYDSAENTAVHWRLPESAYRNDRREAHPQGRPPMTPRELARHFLDEVGPTTKVAVAGTEQVAGRNVYTLSLTPRSAESLVGRVAISVDAQNWTPLRVTVTPRGGGTPAVDVGFTEVSFGEPPASRFEFTPPEGAEVKRKAFPSHGKGSGAGKGAGAGKGTGGETAPGGAGPEVVGQGWTSVLVFDGVPSGRQGGWLARAGERVSGEFGQGRMVTTRLVSALVTDDGRLYVGAVTPAALQRAAAHS